MAEKKKNGWEPEEFNTSGETDRYKDLRDEQLNKDPISDETKATAAELANYGTYNRQDNEVAQAYKSQYDATAATKPVYTDEKGYGDKTERYMSSYEDWMNRGFDYDVNVDPLYQQYKEQYIRGGRQAMDDTLGRASALTGGYDNSYAQSAAQQTYNRYMQDLNDLIPQLEQIAYGRYKDEGAKLRDAADLYNALEEKQYGRYRDTVSDWNAELSRLGQLYQYEDTMGMDEFNANRDYLYTKWFNDRNFDYNDWITRLQQYDSMHNTSYARDFEMWATRQTMGQNQYQYDTSMNEQQYEFDTQMNEEQYQYDTNLANAGVLGARSTSRSGSRGTKRSTDSDYEPETPVTPETISEEDTEAGRDFVRKVMTLGEYEGHYHTQTGYKDYILTKLQTSGLSKPAMRYVLDYYGIN